jgi:hypothetical protein
MPSIDLWPEVGVSNLEFRVRGDEAKALLSGLAFGSGDASAIVGGIGSGNSEDAVGSSGRSSRKRDLVRFGIPLLSLRDAAKFTGGVGS